MASIDDIVQMLKDVTERLDALTQVVPNSIQAHSLSLITHNAGLLTSGEFRSGNNKDPGTGFTGVRLGYPGFLYSNETWQFVGASNDVMQVGIKATDGKLYAGGGNVILDSTGILVQNGGAAGAVYIAFEDSVGVPNMYILADINNVFGLGNDKVGGSVILTQKMSGGQYGTLYLSEYGASSDITGFILLPADGGNGIIFQVRGEPAAEGINIYADATDKHIEVVESTTTPTSPTANGKMNIYMKADKFIIQYDDAGTVRYKYLPLNNTSVTWVYTTTPP